MAATRRLQKELGDLRNSANKSFRDVQVDDSNMLVWQGLLVPDKAPYNKGAFLIDLVFPAEYPFKPPKVSFRTKIYHPNIDEKGQVTYHLLMYVLTLQIRLFLNNFSWNIILRHTPPAEVGSLKI